MGWFDCLSGFYSTKLMKVTEYNLSLYPSRLSHQQHQHHHAQNVGADFWTLSRNVFQTIQQVVAQLVEQLLPTPQDPSLNPVIDKKLYWTFTVNCIEKKKIKKKRPGGPIFKKTPIQQVPSLYSWSVIFSFSVLMQSVGTLSLSLSLSPLLCLPFTWGYQISTVSGFRFLSCPKQLKMLQKMWSTKMWSTKMKQETSQKKNKWNVEHSIAKSPKLSKINQEKEEIGRQNIQTSKSNQKGIKNV